MTVVRKDAKVRGMVMRDRGGGEEEGNECEGNEGDARVRETLRGK